MSKKILITEEEKNNIKSLYNINEQGAGDALTSLANTIVDMIKTGNYGTGSKDGKSSMDGI
jgi:hypothetical protein